MLLTILSFYNRVTYDGASYLRCHLGLGHDLEEKNLAHKKSLKNMLGLSNFSTFAMYNDLALGDFIIHPLFCLGPGPQLMRVIYDGGITSNV